MRQSNFALGLYDDRNGLPGRRVANSATVVFTGTRVDMPSVDVNAGCLTEGRYWLVAYVRSSLDLGQDTSGSGDAVTVTRYFDTGEDIPANWPAGSRSIRTPQLNLFVTYDRP